MQLPEYMSELKLSLHKTALFLMLVIAVLEGHSQDIISNDSPGNKLILKQYADALLKNSDLRIFYPENEFDSLHISIAPNEENPEVVLMNSLEKHGIIINVIDANTIILTSDQKIITKLSSYSENKNEKQTRRNSRTGYDLLKEEKISNGQQDNLPTDVIIGEGVSIPKTATISGIVTNKADGEPVIGATVWMDNSNNGTVTNVAGHYVIKVRGGSQLIRFSSVGMATVEYQADVRGSGTLNVEMEEETIQLRGAYVIADKNKNISGSQMGLIRFDVKNLKNMPSLAGETDLIKSTILLPGVQTVGEGASGFNVRGGSTDQNLILLNGAPIFNSSHLFGFFSAFNPDVVHDLRLYKSAIPASYGGRIASVMDIKMKNGNSKKVKGAVGLSPVTGKILLEGPIIKDKFTFITAMRSSYSDWILKRINNPEISNSTASFYDVNLNLNYDLNARNNINASFYRSYDFFKLNNDTTYNYLNQSYTLHYNHKISESLRMDAALIASDYSYSIKGNENPMNAYDLTYKIGYREGRLDFSWYPRHNHTLKFGTNMIHYNLSPGSLMPVGEESKIIPKTLEDEAGLESALYLSDDYQVTSRILISAGIRYSGFISLGPRTVHQYLDNYPREPYSLVKTINYEKGRIPGSYHGPELRGSMRYLISNDLSVKMSYNRTRQYLHMLSNTTAVSPTDTWKLSDEYIKPQKGNQYSLGVYKDFYNNSIQTSVEIYYKTTTDYIDYKGGAELLLNEFIETDLINGKAQAWGAELMIKKDIGRLNGWVSYTYSRAEAKVLTDFISEQVNGGQYYPVNHDKPNDFTAVANYKFNRRFSLSGTVTYSTGRPITYPAAGYTVNNINLLHYSYRNQYRVPDYFRVDLSANLEGNLKLKKIAHSFWSLSVYNLTGRDNVYSIYFITADGKTNGYKLSVFNRPILTISFNIEF